METEDKHYLRLKELEEKYKPEYEKYLRDMDMQGLLKEAHGIHMWMLWTGRQ